MLPAHEALSGHLHTQTLFVLLSCFTFIHVMHLLLVDSVNCVFVYYLSVSPDVELHAGRNFRLFCFQPLMQCLAHRR